MKKQKVEIKIDKKNGTFKYGYQPKDEHITTNRSLVFYLNKLNDKLNLVLKAQTEVINSLKALALIKTMKNKIDKEEESE